MRSSQPGKSEIIGDALLRKRLQLTCSYFVVRIFHSSYTFRVRMTIENPEKETDSQTSQLIFNSIVACSEARRLQRFRLNMPWSRKMIYDDESINFAIVFWTSDCWFYKKCASLKDFRTEPQGISIIFEYLMTDFVVTSCT